MEASVIDAAPGRLPLGGRGDCPLCGLAPREDDPTATVWADGLGMVTACSPCAFGAAAPAYPPGVRPPSGPTGGDVRVCACCRLALRKGDDYTRLRLRPEDVAGTNAPAGVLLCCPDCAARWRPVVADRLIQAGLIRNVAQATGDWLL